MYIKQYLTHVPRFISGSTLKIIALLFMLCDHIGAAFLAFYIRTFTVTDANLSFIEHLKSLYLLLRGIGRISFPIFCFLLVEGFLHTHDVKKYITRIALFCILSELPFNLAFSHKLFFPECQNVFFTLLIGLLVLLGLQAAFRFSSVPVQGCIMCISLGLGCTIAQLFHTDYGAAGILIIALFYLLHKLPIVAAIIACSVLTLSAPIEAYSFFSVFFIGFYNGQRGLRLKYVFYLFYPLHLCFLYLICQILLGKNA